MILPVVRALQCCSYTALFEGFQPVQLKRSGLADHSRSDLIFRGCLAQGTVLGVKH